MTCAFLPAASLRDDIRSYLPELLPRFIGLFAEAERSGVSSMFQTTSCLGFIFKLKQKTQGDSPSARSAAAWPGALRVTAPPAVAFLPASDVSRADTSSQEGYWQANPAFCVRVSAWHRTPPVLSLCRQDQLTVNLELSQ